MELSTMEEALQKLAERVETVKNSRKEHFKLEWENSELRKEIDTLKSKIEHLKETTQQKSLQNDELRKELDVVQIKIKDQEKQCNTYKEGFHIKSSDSAKMQKAKEILRAGIDFTGIRWNYAAPKDVAKGYIANSHTKMIKPFEFRQDENLPENIWDFIEKASSADWSDLVEPRNYKSSSDDKENMITN